MHYGKLTAMLLQYCSGDSETDPNTLVARYLFDCIHSEKIPGIKDISQNCSVSNSSVSRFCRELGLTDFSELKELMEQAQTNHKSIIAQQELYKWETYGALVGEHVTGVTKTIDRAALRKLSMMIDQADRVAVFGYLRSYAAAICFQNKMLSFGKTIITKKDFEKQAEYLEQAEKNDLIIIFSYTGVYFDYMKALELKGNPQIAMITGGQKSNRYTSLYARFKTDFDHEFQSYEMQAAGDLLFQSWLQLEKKHFQNLGK